MNLKHRFGALLLAVGLASLVGGAAATESVVTFEKKIEWYSFESPTQIFPHNYSFTLPSFSELSTSLYSITARYYGIDNFSLSIFSGSDLVAAPSVVTTAMRGGSEQSLEWSGWLRAGTYTAQVGGALRPQGGDYTLNLLATAPVPEPGEWLMLGIGLLAIGAVARRRMHS